jgi:carbon storage regulator
MLVLTRKAEESITVGNGITVKVIEIKGNQVRLGIEAPKDTPVHRTEIFEKIVQENRRAALRAERHVDLPTEIGF